MSSLMKIIFLLLTQLCWHWKSSSHQCEINHFKSVICVIDQIYLSYTEVYLLVHDCTVLSMIIESGFTVGSDDLFHTFTSHVPDPLHFYHAWDEVEERSTFGSWLCIIVNNQVVWGCKHPRLEAVYLQSFQSDVCGHRLPPAPQKQTSMAEFMSFSVPIHLKVFFWNQM